jgi:hypothetical protein
MHDGLPECSRMGIGFERRCIPHKYGIRMLQRIGKFFRQRITSRIRPAFRMRTRYTRALEEEILRLRAENRALVNSILGVAGIPPMRAAALAGSGLPAQAGFTPGRARETRKRTENSGAQSLSVGATLGPSGRGKPRPYNMKTRDAEAILPAAPLRRRSWQQIGRALEIEDARAARRERESDTETFPAPRRVVPRL